MSGRPYIKLDPFMPDRKAYYPDGAFRALVETFCAASHQPEPGEFKSAKLLKVLLGARARWVPFLMEEADIGLSSTGVIFVNGWAEWQEKRYSTVRDRMAAIEGRRSPMTPAERAFTYRQRKRDAARDGDAVTLPVTDGIDRNSHSDFDINPDKRDGLKNPGKKTPSPTHTLLSRIGKAQ